MLRVFSGLAVALLHGQIGHRTMTFNDPSRTGGFGSGGGPGRQIQTEIYYPATSAGTNATIQVGSFPVVIIGHGFLMEWSAYQNLWEAIVPAGYIVALPRTEGGFSPSHQDFALDMRVIAQRMIAEGQNPSSPFYQRIHPKVALMGHSMGGGCAVLAAQNFSGAVCVIGLAAANTNPSAISAAPQVSMPALILAGSGDSVTPPHAHQIPIYNALGTSCKWFVSLTGGGHCYFANNSTTCSFGESSAGSSITLTRAQQQGMTQRLLLPFLNAYLKDSCLAKFLDTLSAMSGITFQEQCSYQRLSIQGQVTAPTSQNPTGGAIDLMVSGGHPPYSYTWSHGFSGANPSGLAAGSYTVLVRDAKGCVAETTFVLSLTTEMPKASTVPARIFTNPFSQTLCVEVSADKIGQPWRLMDTNGRVISEGVIESLSFTLFTSQMPKGPYFFTLGQESIVLIHAP